jgi:hypothetical protein
MEDQKIDENVFVRKGKMGYRIIYPYKINGKISWFNLLLGGSWWNFWKTMFFVVMILLMVGSYKHDIISYKNITDICLGEPCKFCEMMKASQLNKPAFQLNISVMDNLEVRDE